MPNHCKLNYKSFYLFTWKTSLFCIQEYSIYLQSTKLNFQKIDNMEPLCETNYSNDPVCGTDGKDYGNLSFLRCESTTEYGRSVNLQLRHRCGCFIWEKYGIHTYIVLLVSELPIDSIAIEEYFIFVNVSLQLLLIFFFFLVCVAASVELSIQRGKRKNRFQK